MSRRAQVAWPLVGVLVVAGSFPIWWRYVWVPEPAVAAQGGAPVQVEGKVLDVMLRRAGIDPQSLAAAGVSGQSATSVLQAAATHAALHASELTAADTAFLAAKPAADRLQRTIQAGKASQEDVASYQQRKAAADAAAASRDAALDALFAATIANLSEGQRAALTQIRANRHWQLPLEFLVVDRTEAQWVELRGDLAHEKFCAKYHETPDQASTSRLASARANGSVAAATQGLAANATAVTSSWNAALAQ